jgi:hypothetical protein
MCVPISGLVSSLSKPLTGTGWGQRFRLKVVDDRNLSKPVKMALRMKSQVAKSPDELLI